MANESIMLKNYMLSAARHLLRYKGYTVLNALGLSLGLACFALISFWMKNELSYDRFHQEADNIYRIAGNFRDESGEFDQAVTCIPLAPALKNDLPEVTAVTRIDKNDAVVERGESKFNEAYVMAVDPSFLTIFDFKLLSGNRATALKDPYTVLISESMAKKYFGKANPLGESIKIYQYDPDGKGADYKITGVIEDCPANSHFQYNFLFSFSTIEKANPQGFGYDGWFNNGYYTYVLLHPGTDLQALNRKLATFLDKYIGPDMKKSNVYWSYFLQPITDIHLGSHLRYEIYPTSSFTYVFVFGSIGFITLLLAAINYVNLSTAYASSRFKEVGVRKVLGAFRGQLLRQYLVESWMLAMVSLMIAVVWIELSRPFFESISGKEIKNFYTLESLSVLVALATVVGVLAGFYPSLVLSSGKTVSVLKGAGHGVSRAWLRKGLVVFQYAITIVLIAGIFVIQQQMKFIHQKDLGFDKENLLVLNVNGSGEVHAGYNAFANELVAKPVVANVSRSNQFIAGGLGNTGALFTEASGKKVRGTIFVNGVDENYIATYGMKLLAGRNFAGPADSISVIVNEFTAKTYGYQKPEDAVGSAIAFGDFIVNVIGVVRDFNFNTLHNKIGPVCLYLNSGGASRIAVRLSGDVNDGVDWVTTTWKKHFPNSIVDFSFAEDRIQTGYEAEQRFSKIFLLFSIISLTIACLGLFALVSYAVETRTKEIGIRKVLGASVGNILNMISREFLSLVALSAVIGVPLAWFLMERWLRDFEYRVDLNPVVFVLATASVMALAWLTVSARSINAATTNPVDSLRTE